MANTGKRKILLILLLLQTCLMCFSQTNKIQIDTSLQKTIDRISLQSRLQGFQSDTAYERGNFANLVCHDSLVYKALSFHTTYKTIITEEPRYYFVDYLPDIILPEGKFSLLFITESPSKPQFDIFGLLKIKNAFFFVSTYFTKTSHAFYRVNFVRIPNDKKDPSDWAFDGFERQWFYLLSDSGELYRYSRDVFAFGEESGNEDHFFVRMDF